VNTSLREDLAVAAEYTQMDQVQVGDVRLFRSISFRFSYPTFVFVKVGNNFKFPQKIILKQITAYRRKTRNCAC